SQMNLIRDQWSAESFHSFIAAIDPLYETIRAEEVVCPTLVVGCEADGEASRRQSQELALRFERGQLVAADIGQGIVDWKLPGLIDGFLASEFPGSGTPVALADPAPAAIRAILFTDIEGHPAMMQRLGDAKGREVLREHERITREALAAHGGAEVKTM